MKKALLALVVLAALTAAPQAGYPTHPGANGSIVFTRSITIFDADIFSINPDGTGLTDLTPVSSHDSHATWSPDGKSIAFVSNRDGPYSLYTMNADGSGVTRLTAAPEPIEDTWPSWSPSGQQIVFARLTQTSPFITIELFTINADGTGLTQLTSGAEDAAPDWSPDGSEIAFSRYVAAEAKSSIFSIRPDGNGLRRVTNFPRSDVHDSAPDWAPDGRRLLFTRHENDGSLISMRSDGTDEHILVVERNLETGVYSPDGSMIAFSYDGLVNLARVDGANRVTLTSGAAPDWQPAGPSCSVGGLFDARTLLNSDSNETGAVSSPVHTQLETMVKPNSPARRALHEANCDAIITVEHLAG